MTFTAVAAADDTGICRCLHPQISIVTPIESHHYSLTAGENAKPILVCLMAKCTYKT